MFFKWLVLIWLRGARVIFFENATIFKLLRLSSCDTVRSFCFINYVGENQADEITAPVALLIKSMSYNQVFTTNLKLYLTFVALITFTGERERNDTEKNGFEFERLENSRPNS